MKEMMAKLFNELNVMRGEEESVVCFLEKLHALNNPDVNTLIKFYRLNVTKGPDFDKLIIRVDERMEALKLQDEKNAKEKQTSLEQAQPVPGVPPNAKPVK